VQRQPECKDAKAAELFLFFFFNVSRFCERRLDWRWNWWRELLGGSSASPLIPRTWSIPVHYFEEHCEYVGE
jgi:hypothetical protein